MAESAFELLAKAIGVLMRAIGTFIFEMLFDLIGTLVRATGTLIIRGLTFGRVRTAPLFPASNDPTPLIGTQTWDGTWVAGPWISFVVGLLFWIVLVASAIRLL